MSQSRRGSRKKRALRKQIRGILGTGRCCFCDTERAGTLEHVVPLSLGGTWHISNLRLSCSPCNQERGVTDFEEFRRAKSRTL